MDIASADTHQCLAFLISTQRQGYVLTVAEFRAYARRPRREQWTTGFKAVELLKGYQRRTEAMLDYLYRLGWVDITGPDGPIEDIEDFDYIKDDDHVVPTPLGRAVLAALDDGSEERELSATVVLDQHDPIAKAKVISEIAGIGECALVDRFFSADDILAVLHRTEVSRVLTGPPDKKRLAGLGQALADIKLTRDFEIRVSDAFHDRFAIPHEGDIIQIGTSLGGVSKRLSVMVHMTDDAAARAIRQAFDAAWTDASPLEPQLGEEVPDARTKSEAKGGERSETENGPVAEQGKI